MKQERRGGIETLMGQTPLVQPLPGSRNAVVALKRYNKSDPVFFHNRSRNAVVALKPADPDRRLPGPAGSRNAVVALKPKDRRGVGHNRGKKQERRGGIETASGHGCHPARHLEAGTPWWH